MGRRATRRAASKDVEKRDAAKGNAEQTPSTLRLGGRRLEWLGWLGLFALAICFLAVSWRKWPDPLIDFGRELYTPWRLSHGALLYRDVDEFYGPLSQYFNAGLFAAFGPGLMVLVFANLAIFCAICGSLYILFRKAWGSVAAFTSVALFISVFGFGQYVGLGNFNYATPYSHEVTHGVLVCLLLALALLRWLELSWMDGGTLLYGFLSGMLLGLSAVLKPEILLPAALLSLAAFGLRWWFGRTPSIRSFSIPEAGVWSAGVFLPTVSFAAYFSIKVPWSQALSMACRAWLNLTSSAGHTADDIQRGFLGLDHPAANLLSHTRATLLAAALIAALGLAARFIDHPPVPWVRMALAITAIAGIPLLAYSAIDWFNVGRCFLGLTLVYLAICATEWVRRPQAAPAGVLTARTFAALLAAGLLLRMLLNGRFYQYGFYQAAIAGALIPAVLIGELPERLSLGRWGRSVIIAGVFLLLVPGIATVTKYSWNILGWKTLPVGNNGDQFYAYKRDVNITGAIVQTIYSRLANSTGASSHPSTLLVLPEGEMINYLARLPNPVAPFEFYSAAIANGREAGIVGQLRQRPPDWVALISRDLREYGVQRYGEAPGKGQQILEWVNQNYTRDLALGGDPLDPDQSGAILFRRKPSPEAALSGASHRSE